MRLRDCLLLGVISLIFSCSAESKHLILRDDPGSEKAGLMVMNFKNCTQKKMKKEFQPWEYGIASMLMTDIHSIGLFKIISKEDLRKIIDEQQFQHSGLVDVSQAIRLGKLAAAKYILTGSFLVMNENLRIEARVLSVEEGTQLGSASITGEIKKFFELEKQLVVKISRYLNVMLDENEVSKIAMNIETKSIDASLNNYAGEIEVIKADELKEKGESDMAEKYRQQAKKNFKKALKYDPNFVRAKRNLSKLVMGMPITL